MYGTLITFETAKLAKDVGFIKDLLNYYSPNYFDANGEEWLGVSSNMSDYKDKYPRPYQSVVQAFLREEYNIHIMIKYHEDDYKRYYQAFIKENGESYSDAIKNEDGVPHSPSIFNTYEEALEAVLLVGLKTVKIITTIYYLEDFTKENSIDWIKGLNASGFAGVNKLGQIVDRREFPNVIPVPANSQFGIAKPRQLWEKKDLNST